MGRRARSPLPAEGIALGVASGFVEAAYFILLSAAYRRGDLSVVYPVARGTAPLLAVLIGVGRASASGWAWRARSGWSCCWSGSCGSSDRGGRSPLARRGWRPERAPGRGRQRDPVRARDRRDDRHVHGHRPGRDAADRPVPVRRDPVGDVLGRAGRVGRGRGRRRPASRTGPAATRRAAVGGCLTLAAYLCILVALSVAPLSGVAPLRESATVFAAAWGSVRLGEASDRSEAIRRIGASVLIVGGALLLAVGG